MAKKSTQAFAKIMASVRKKQFQPVYFLAGEEPYFIDTIADTIEATALQEEEKEFNQQILYGRETDAHTVIAEAMRYPMMSERVVVIVREAQHMKELEPFEAYVKNPSASTILVICHKYKKLDKRKTLARTIDKAGFLFESAKLYDSELPDWVTAMAQQGGHKISPRAAAMLADFLGNDLSRLANEIEKLTLNLPDGTEIDERMVSTFTGVSREYNNFELSSAIAVRDMVKANKIVNYFAANPKDNPMVVTLSILYNFFSKLLVYHNLADKHDRKSLASAMGVNPFFMREYETAGKIYSATKTAGIIGYLRKYDLRSKGVDNVSTSHGELLKELVFRIMH